jgi:MFS family permease
MIINAPHRPTRHAAQRQARPILILAVVLVAALAINVETTIVNVALPTLNSELGASTRGLQWIVDAYNLAFAALVLAGGTIGDKFGRRGTLIVGLVFFAVTSVGAALCTSTEALCRL